MIGRIDFVGESGAVPVGDLETAIARARAGDVVVRAIEASPFFDDRGLAEIQAVSEASIPFSVLPSPLALAAALYGKRVAITRAPAQAIETARMLRRRGATPVFLPTIEIGPAENSAPLASAVRALATYDVVAFTSANGVDASFAALREAELDARAFGAARVAAIGPGTRLALERYGIRADIEPSEHRGEALAVAILAHAPRRVLLSRAAVARDVLPEMIRAAGVTIDVVEAYRTRTPARAVFPAPFDAITFTSASTVEHFVELFPSERLESVVVASIGPITSEACLRLGVRIDVEANPYTLPALVSALEARFSGR